MNKERILEIADLIEAGHKSMVFNMMSWGVEHPCGTAACIAGWAVARFGKNGRAKKIDPRRPLDVDYNVWGGASGALGLEDGRARALFMPSDAFEGINMEDVTAEHAVRTLRHLAETGKVDWLATASPD